MIQAHWTHQILVTCIFPTPCNHFHTHLVVYRAITSKCCVSPILNKYYSILRRTAIVLSCVTVAVCLVFSKLQDPFSNLLRVVQQSACLDFHLCPYFFRQSQIQETHSFFNVSEHKLKIIYILFYYILRNTVI